jgi:hypothetical protein
VSHLRIDIQRTKQCKRLLFKQRGYRACCNLLQAAAAHNCEPLVATPGVNKLNSRDALDCLVLNFLESNQPAAFFIDVSASLR